MTTKRRMPYAAKAHVEDAQARLREADLLIDEELAEDPPKKYVAAFALLSRLIEKAQADLSAVKRIGYERRDIDVDQRAAAVPAAGTGAGRAGDRGG